MLTPGSRSKRPPSGGSQTNFLGFSFLFPNPKGIETFSPGLRGTSYPGEKGQIAATLQGLNHRHNIFAYPLLAVFDSLSPRKRGESRREGNPFSIVLSQTNHLYL